MLPLSGRTKSQQLPPQFSHWVWTCSMQRDPADGPDTTLTARLMKPPGGGREARRGSGVTIHTRHLTGGKICVSVRRVTQLKAEQNVIISHLNFPFFLFLLFGLQNVSLHCKNAKFYQEFLVEFLLQIS